VFRKLTEAFKSRGKMEIKQPDPRIPVKGLSTFPLDGKRYVSHGQPGCPRNACIEYFESANYLRCGFCFKPLTQEAATHILDNSEMTEQKSFIWNE